MRTRYAKWMYDWEDRLTSVDNNRVVRPLDWGVEWAHTGPAAMEFHPDRCLPIRKNSLPTTINGSLPIATNFIPIRVPTDFRLERREVQVFSTREVPDPRLEEKVRGSKRVSFVSPLLCRRLIRKTTW